MTQMSDEMKSALTDVDYPAKKGEIMDSAKAKKLSQPEMDMIQKLPDREYTTMTEVTDELGKMAGGKMM
jgi:hypothetical protein